MPAKKNKKNTDEQETVETVDPQQAAFEKLSATLTTTFEQGFEKLQQALVNMAPRPPAATEPPATDNQQQENPHGGYDTRNKALRPLYNPPAKQPPVKAKPKKPPTKKAAPITHEQDAMEIDPPEVTYQAQPSVGHVEFPKVNKPVAPSPESTTLAVNKWIVNQAVKKTPSATITSAQLPTSAAQMATDVTLEAQVQQVLRNTATHLAKGNQNPGFYPHKYVTRGPEQKEMGLNSLTVLEYLAGILCMIKDEAVPQADKPYIYAHLEEIIEDARDFEWSAAVRPWSEEIFTLIAKGRLPGGWAAQNKKQLLRMSISRASTARLAQPPQYNHTQQRARQQNPQPSNDHNKGGSPCINFNSQQGCNFSSGHFVNGRKVIHICAFCLWNTATANPHPECFCRNKLRYNNPNHF